jgi:hypothetical protein
LARLPETRRTFLKPDGSAYQAGEVFRQPALAETLRQVAKLGAGHMYGGEWGERLVRAVRASNPRIRASGTCMPVSEDDMSLTYGVAVLARPTFDVPFAEDMKTRAFAALEAAGIRTVGPRELLFDRAAAERAVAEIRSAGPIDLLLILQITFTDATMTVKLAKEATTPIAIWAVPEPRIGGRLRLNAYCGLNLAAHALGRAGVSHGWLYAAPDAPDLAASLRALATPAVAVPSRARPAQASADSAADRVLDSLRGSKITVVGQHPDGFDTCEYDEKLLFDLAGLRVETVQLGQLFDKARAMDPARVGAARAGAGPRAAAARRLAARDRRAGDAVAVAALKKRTCPHGHVLRVSFTGRRRSRGPRPPARR